MNVIKRGADDYILKDRLERLPTAINNALEKYRLEKKNQSNLFDLIKNERHYRALIENGGDVLVVFTEEGKPKYVSPSVQKVLGYTEEEALNLNLFEVLHPDDREATVERWATALQNPGQALSGHESRMRNKSGEWIWLEATMTNMLHDPAINGIVDNFRDITERKLARLQLIKSQLFNKSILSSLDAHIAVVDESGIIVSVNKAWDDFAIANGGSSPLLTSKGSNYFQVCEEAARGGSEIAQLALSGLKSVLNKQIELFKLEYPCHSAKEERWFVLNATSLGGDEASIVVSHQNITDRKLAEQKMIHANRLYSFISQINQTIVHVKDDQILFKEACRIAVECGKFKMAWIGVPYPETNTIELVASYGATTKSSPILPPYPSLLNPRRASFVNAMRADYPGKPRNVSFYLPYAHYQSCALAF